MTLSRYARVRAQQRAIPPMLLDILLRFADAPLGACRPAAAGAAE